jgi:hypothetical protein
MNTFFFNVYVFILGSESRGPVSTLDDDVHAAAAHFTRAHSGFLHAHSVPIRVVLLPRIVSLNHRRIRVPVIQQVRDTPIDEALRLVNRWMLPMRRGVASPPTPGPRGASHPVQTLLDVFHRRLVELGDDALELI